MWTERFVIVVGSLYQEFLPANWGKYLPTRWDIGLYIGTLGRLFHPLPAVRQISADDRNFRSQRRHACRPIRIIRLAAPNRRLAMSEKLYGIMAEFNSPGEVLRAAKKVRAAGYRRWDVFSPFPGPWDR